MKMEKRKKDFIAYEYKEVTVVSDKASFLLDGYENFGWEIDDKISETLSVPNFPSANKVTLHFKRDRKILNKMELTRLQRNFEACLNEIDVLEGRKTSKATTSAMTVAMIGCAFLALSVFSITAQTPSVSGCILFGIPGIIGWILPYFVYRGMVSKQTMKVGPLIEAKYDEIYEICEKGNKLLF